MQALLKALSDCPLYITSGLQLEKLTSHLDIAYAFLHLSPFPPVATITSATTITITPGGASGSANEQFRALLGCGDQRHPVQSQRHFSSAAQEFRGRRQQQTGRLAGIHENDPRNGKKNCHILWRKHILHDPCNCQRVIKWTNGSWNPGYTSITSYPCFI